MAQEDNIKGWTFYESMTGAYRNDAVADCEIDVDEESIQIRCQEGGSGYLSQQTSANIPVEVMARIMRQAGYTVTKDEKTDETVQVSGDKR